MPYTPTWNETRLAAVARGDEPADLAIVGGRVLSVHTREWLDADLLVAEGRVAAVVERAAGTPSSGTPVDASEVVDATGRYVVPGYIDAHVHIESSKLTVGGFAEAIVPRGTTTVVAEPHEVGNVLGVEGTRWFMDSAEGSPLDCWFMVPSCVPASQFESAGAHIDVAGMEQLLEHPRALGIGELMNFPAIVGADPGEMDKRRAIGASHADGHAPGVRGRHLDAYAAARINSDHESTELAEALDKRRRGIWVLMREASNARNLADLLPLVREHGPSFTALCTDDREPDHLVGEGHFDHLLRVCIAGGVDPIDALLLATLHPALAHGLRDHGALVPGARADVLVLPDLETFLPDLVWSAGRLVAKDGKLLVEARTPSPASVMDTVHVAPLDDASFRVDATDITTDTVSVRVVGARDGQLLTDHRVDELPVDGSGAVLCDVDQDIAKLAVVERHRASGRIGTGFVHGFGLRSGAFASTVAHDAHNCVVVGADDASMRASVERLAEIGGGIVVAREGQIVGELPLPVAGIMTDAPPHEVAATMDRLHSLLREQGVTVDAPFMVLSFLALSVIPSLKLTDRGYVDVDRFELVEVVTSDAVTA
ncbi:MAG: Adenine deaminase [Thermoleophilia bacterium]|nr:Adenine deaminase [Thermoleophilia bacterium]